MRLILGVERFLLRALATRPLVPVDKERESEMRNRMPLLFAAVFALGCAMGCHHEKKETVSPTSSGNYSGSSPAAASSAGTAAGGGKTCNSDMECGAKQLCIRGQCVDITPDLAEC